MHGTTLLGLVFLAGLAMASHAGLQCGPNERLEGCNICPQPSCMRPDIPNKRCFFFCNKPGCVCAEGYYRDDRLVGGSGKCVTPVVCDLI